MLNIEFGDIKSKMKKQSKILSYSFYFLSFCFLIFSILSYRNIFADGPGMYLVDLSNIENAGGNPFGLFLQRVDDAPVFFSYVLLRLIYMLFYPIFCGSISVNFNLYTFSVIAMPYICLFLNFLAAKRTLRYDIAIFALLMFCLFCLPYSAWLLRESTFSLMLQFLLLQFFLSRKKNNKTDLIIIFFLILFNFESFENMAILSILFIIFGLISYKKKVINYKTKLVIAISNLFILCWICFTSLFAIFNNDYERTTDYMVPWTKFLLNLPDSTMCTCMIVSIISFILILFCMKFRFSKNKFNLITLSAFIFAITILFIKTNFLPRPRTETNLFMYTLIISPIIFFLFMLFDLKKIRIKKHNLREILIVVLITGCIQLLWQINACRYYYLYFQTLKICMESSEKRFVSHHFEDDSVLSYCDVVDNSSIIRSIIVQNGHCKNLILPDKKHIDYSDNRYKGLKNYYDQEQKKLYLLDVSFNIENKFWDLRPIVEKNPEMLDNDLLNLDNLYTSSGND